MDDRTAEMKRLIEGEKWTYAEVGEAYGISKQRVHALLHPPGFTPKKKRGPKKGTRREGSWPTKLADLEVGESLWVETTVEARQRDMTKAIPHGKRVPAQLEGRKYATALYTAVG